MMLYYPMSIYDVVLPHAHLRFCVVSCPSTILYYLMKNYEIEDEYKEIRIQTIDQMNPISISPRCDRTIPKIIHNHY